MAQQDTSYKDSVISEDEQKEIISAIERASAFASPYTNAIHTKPSKKGFIFPLFVNIVAIILLLGGFLFLFYFRGSIEKHDVASRDEANVTLNSTEGRLIQELRREAAAALGNTGGRISEISQRLAAIEDELKNTASLGDKKKELEKEKLRLETELAALQNDRLKIVQNVRMKKADIGNNGNNADIDALRDLNAGDEKNEFFTRELKTYYYDIEQDIRRSHIKDAQDKILRLQTFVNSPSMQSVRMVREQKDMLNSAINSLSLVINSSTDRKFTQAERAWSAERNEKDKLISALQWRNTILEQQVISLDPDNQKALLDEKQSEIEELKTKLSSSAQETNQGTQKPAPVDEAPQPQNPQVMQRPLSTEETLQTEGKDALPPESQEITPLQTPDMLEQQAIEAETQQITEDLYE